nr:hypothetical protein [uncultured bacterium]
MTFAPTNLPVTHYEPRTTVCVLMKRSARGVQISPRTEENVERQCS